LNTVPTPVYSKKSGKGKAAGIKLKQPLRKKASIGLYNGPEWEERMVSRVAVWMLEGIREPAALLEEVTRAFPQLPVSFGDCKRWQKAVFARWELAGAKGEPRVARGEALASLEHLTRILWKDYHSIPSFKLKDRAKIYQLIMDASERWCRLRGVEDGVPDTDSDGSGEFLLRLRRQKEMADYMGRFADLIAKKRRLEAEKKGHAARRPGLLYLGQK
jgi:hypothetical protein